MARITDPALLAQLNGVGETPADQTLALFDPSGNAPVQEFGPAAMTPPATQPAAPARKKVADPALLAQLNHPSTPKLPTVFGSEAPARVLSTIGDNPVSTGIKEGLTNRGIGVIQMVYQGMKHSGMVEPIPELEAAIQKAHANEEAAAQGSGVGGAVGEIVGDPINWIGGGTVGGAAVKGLGKKAALKVLAKQGARAGAITGAAAGATGITEGDETRIGNTAKMAGQGAVIGAALPTGARAIGVTGRGTTTAAGDIIAAGKSGTGRSPEQLQQVVSDMAAEGGRLAQAMRDNNVAVTPQGGRDILSRVAGAIRKAGFQNDVLPGEKDLHPVTRQAFNELARRVDDGSLDVVSLDALRQKLNDAASTDRGLAGQFRSAMEEGLAQPNSVAGNPAALDLRDQFLQQWQKKSRFEDVAGLAEKANSDPNRIRTAVDKFTDDPANTKNLQPNELQALLRSGKRNMGEKALGLAGSLGIDMGSISRNPRALVPLLMASTRSAAQGGAGYAMGGPVPVVVGTVANSIRNRIANGKLEKALREIEKRPITVTPRAAPAPAAPVTPQLPGPASPLALPAPPTIMVPGGPGGALRPATDVERAAMYAQRGQTPELEVPTAGAPRAPSTVQQQANDSVRTQYKDMSLTPDVLRAQRGRQITAAEAQKAMQDAAAQAQRTAQVAGSGPQPTVGDMFQQSQASAADRAAATGDSAPSLGSVGEALRRALQGF